MSWNTRTFQFLAVVSAAVIIERILRKFRRRQLLPKKSREHRQLGKSAPKISLSSVKTCIHVPSSAITPETLREWLTVVMTTSPVVSNPETALIEEVAASFKLVEHLASCPKLIMCDGYKVKEKNKFRSGQITTERADAYNEYKSRLHSLSTQPGSLLYGAQIEELDTRNGFGFAMRAALPHVTTPYMIVVQHDRTFRAGFDLVKVVRALHAHGDWLHYVGMPTGTTTTHITHVLSKYGLRIKPREVVLDGGIDQLRLIPLLQWYDSTHVAATKYYSDFVFDPRIKRVARGGFIEDKLGQMQLQEVRAQGLGAHEPYGTFLLDCGGEVVVGHLDGHDRRNSEKFVHMTSQMKTA